MAAGSAMRDTAEQDTAKAGLPGSFRTSGPR